jgi:UDP:flavonoid glycosyltransferase YjiC (YdhE family)
MIPLARELGRRGHRVAIASSASFVPTLRRFGMNVLAFDPDWIVRPGDPVYDRTVGSHTFFGVPQVPDAASVAGLVELARRFGADLVLREYSEFSGWFVARTLGVPLVTHGIIHRLPPPAEKGVADVVGRLAEQLGIAPPPTGDDLLGRVYVDVVPPSFRNPWEHGVALARAARPALFDGSEAAPPAWLAELGRRRPLVYVTLGTIFTNFPSLWKTLFEAMSRLNVDALVTTGSSDPAEMPEPPPNVRLERYVPQSYVLPVASAIVCHGGFNSLIGAFVHGVPAVCLPLDADQPVNAARCAEAGAGLNLANAPARDPRGPLLDPDTLSPDAVVHAVTRVLVEASFRSATARLSGEIAAMPGPAETVGWIEQLAAPSVASDVEFEANRASVDQHHT